MNILIAEDDAVSGQALEATLRRYGYVSIHSEAEFSHSVCPQCPEQLYPDHNFRVADRRPGGT